MNPIPSFLRRAGATLGCVLLLAGCLHERVVWSPDGRRAAVLAADGLRLTDAAGNLSPVLLAHGYRVAWLGDSQRLVVAHTRPVKDFATLARALGPERTAALTAKAEALWQQWQPLKSTKELPSIKPDDHVFGLLLYLRERYPERLKQKAGDAWKKIESSPVELHTLSAARLAGDQLELGAQLHESLARVREIRPAPGGLAVAFVTPVESSPESDDSLQILLSPMDGAAPAKAIASRTSAFPDWSADGRSLRYFKGESGGSHGDDLRLGTLTSTTVLDASGKITAASTPVAHAGLIFHDRNRVRTLRDGRVLINAAEFRLPISAKERDTREEFFVVDPATQAVTRLFPRDRLTALPQSLASFELSPDGQQILVANENGGVWLLTPADQRVEEIYAGFGKDDSVAPAWRLPGEFSYRKKIGARAEVVQRRGAAETVLSRTWSDEVLTMLAK